MSRQLLDEKMTPVATGVATAPVRDAGATPSPGTPDTPVAGVPALRVADLTKSFRSGLSRRRVRGIEGISFTVGRGEVFALLGHNGAGKTTTIGCLLDMVRPDRGSVELLGRDNRHLASRARVGYLPERPYFFDYLTGRELLEFYADLLDVPRRERRNRIEVVLRQVDMLADAGRRLNKYSKGMLQRLGLAQALLGDPELLILDEPMSGLDPLGRREVRSLLQDLKRQGKTIVLSSHIVPDVEQLADAVGILRNGRLVLHRRLDSRANDCTYLVWAGASAATVRRAALPAWSLGTAASANAGAAAHGETTPLTAADAGQLRELLDACHRAGLPVQSVESQRSGLEELFLQTHSRRTDA